jgi:hypothetical protein
MFHRLVEGRNRHLAHEAAIERKVAVYLQGKGKQPPPVDMRFKAMNAKAWAASIILVVPAFVILYLLTRDLTLHEREEDAFLAAALPERVFMTQTIPLNTYVLVTIVTLGVGGVYWLYKLVNLYNAHYKADLQVEKEISRLMEEEKAV